MNVKLFGINGSARTVNGFSPTFRKKFNGQPDRLWVLVSKSSWCYRNPSKLKCRIIETPFERLSTKIFPHIRCEHKKRLRVNNHSTEKPFWRKFLNPNLKEIFHINSENMKFNHKTESSEEFLVKLRNLTMKAYPTPVDQPVALVYVTVVGDQDRFDRETRENDNRGNFAQMQRERHIIRLFRKAMPFFIRPLEQPKTAAILELWTKATQKLFLSYAQ